MACLSIKSSKTVKKLTTHVNRRNVARASAVVSTVQTPKRLRAGPQVVETPLPKIYVYDHCPFCVRVRVALGLKNVKHEVVFMANDDFDTPKALCGKKIAPILEIPGDLKMTESMDIVDFFEADAKYGPTGFIKPKTDRSDIKEWQKKTKDLLRLLHRPRYMMAALPEFHQEDSRDYFVSSHPVPPYDKPEWKAEEFGMEKRWEEYNNAYSKSDELVPQLNEALVELEDLIYSEDYCTEGGLSMDDVDLWARLRSVTLVKGAKFGPKTMKYLENLAVAGDVPLYFSMAC